MASTNPGTARPARGSIPQRCRPRRPNCCETYRIDQFFPRDLGLPSGPMAHSVSGVCRWQVPGTDPGAVAGASDESFRRSGLLREDTNGGRGGRSPPRRTTGSRCTPSRARRTREFPARPVRPRQPSAGHQHRGLGRPPTAHDRMPLTNRGAGRLENGATSVWLRLGTGGIPISDLPEALNGVHLDMVSIVLDAGADTTKATEELLALANAQGVAPRALRGSLGADPLGAQARTGETASPATAAELARKCASELPGCGPSPWTAPSRSGQFGQPGARLHPRRRDHLRWLTEAGGRRRSGAAAGFPLRRHRRQFLTIAKLRAAGSCGSRSPGLRGRVGPRPAARGDLAACSPAATRG